jgi:hypothetical protein
MGTYLVNGIVKDILIPKKHISYPAITIDNITTSLQNELNLDYYNFSEDTDGYYWEIQPKVLEGNLTAFLTAQFNMYKPKSESKKEACMEEAILKIQGAANGQEIIDLACSKKLISFQLVDYIMEYLPVTFDKGFSDSVRAHFSMMTYFMDGKIIMECYGNILKYFEHLIRLQRSQYPIVDCVKVQYS